MEGVHLHTRRNRGRMRRGEDRPSSVSRPQAVPTRAVADRDDRLLAPLRRHPLWFALGLLVAVVAAGTRLVSITGVPPSFKPKPFAHATGSTELVIGQSAALKHLHPDRYLSNLSPRAYTLADMVASPALAKYIARAAGLPVTRIGIMAPLWTELQRAQQWATGPKRANQIISENDPYHITLNVEAASLPYSPVIDVQTQTPSTGTAARLASAVGAGLSAYLSHLQTTTGVPRSDRYDVRQLVPVSVVPARTSQLINVVVFTFLAVCVLWCGLVLAVSSLMRDLREATAASHRRDDLIVVSQRPLPMGPTDASA
jgi:hypothetical protein